MRRVAVEHITETAKTALRGIATSGASPEVSERLAGAVLNGLNKYQMPAHAKQAVVSYWQGIKAMESA